MQHCKEYRNFDCVGIFEAFKVENFDHKLLFEGESRGFYIKVLLTLELFVGVTTIAGGKSNVAGYRDGPSEDAKFSNDFDVVYVRPTCSLLVIDRGNAALRQISLNQEDCDYEDSSISATGVDYLLFVLYFRS